MQSGIIKTLGIIAVLLSMANAGRILAQQPQTFASSARTSGSSSRSAFRPLFGNNVHVYLEGKGQSYPVRNLIYDPNSSEFLRTEERPSTAPIESYRGQASPKIPQNPGIRNNENTADHIEAYRNAGFYLNEEEIPRFVHVSASQTEKSPILIPKTPNMPQTNKHE